MDYPFHEYWKETVDNSNVAQLLVRCLGDRPNDSFIECDGVAMERHEALSELGHRVDRMRRSGVRPGSRILLFDGGGAYFWLDLIAILAVGAVAIPLEATIPAKQLRHILDLADPDWIIGNVKDAGAHDVALPRTLTFERLNGEQAGAIDASAIANLQGSELAALMFTSGTTGDPKGVKIRHDMLSMNALGTQTRLRLLPTDRLGLAIPFRFISSISHFLVAVLAGAAFVTTERQLLPRDLVAFIDSHGLTAFGGAPVQLRILAEAPPEVMPDLRWVMSSGDHLSPKIIDALTASRPDIAINCVYGLTELAGRFCILSSDLLEIGKGSVGTAIPGLALSVLDDDGHECAIGEIGHVYANGICCFDGYLGNEAATEEALDAHGFRTGDLGRLDELGFLHLAGRSDSVFKRAGLKVSCLPISDALMATGCFSDVAVMPRENELAGAVPVAYVVPHDQGFDRGDVLRMLREMIPPNHLPATFVTLPEIPRTGSGKIKRRDLKELVDKANNRL